MSEVTFTITAKMEERWVNHFLNFLERMEIFGAIGHSELLAFYADGDGDFKPKFNFSDNVKAKPLFKVPYKKVSKRICVFDANNEKRNEG